VAGVLLDRMTDDLSASISILGAGLPLKA